MIVLAFRLILITLAGVWSFLESRRRVSASRLADGLEQLALLLEQGFSPEEALRWMMEKHPDHRLRRLGANLVSRLRDGETLDHAWNTTPGLPTELAPAIRGARTSPQLAGRIRTWVGRCRRQREFRAECGNALVYPACVLLLGTAVIAFMVVTLVPRYEAIFAQFGEGWQLPVATRVLSNLSGLLREHWLGIAALLAGGWAVLWLLWANARRFRDGVGAVFRILPVAGVWTENQRTHDFCETLGLILDNHRSMSAALDAMRSDNQANEWLEWNDLQQSIARGSTLAAALAESGGIAPDAVALIAAGEEGGRLTECLLRAAEAAAARQRILAKRIQALLEPAMIVGLSFVVGGLALALFLPLVTVITEMNQPVAGYRF